MRSLIVVGILLGCVYAVNACGSGDGSSGGSSGGSGDGSSGGSSSSCVCGKKKPSRIVGGVETQANEYPWQILLKYNGQHVCGGSIISKDWILTAAHCMGYTTSGYSVVVGEHDKSSDDSISQTISVSEKIVHSGYSSSTYDNDIGLFKLSSPITFSSEISPACLPFNLPELSSGDVLTVTGWGTTSSGGSTSSVLLEVDVNYLTNAQCSSSSYGYGSKITDNMLCAATAGGGKDACQGDSGGPIVYKYPSNNHYYLVGVVSWGYGCADANYPGVYARVTRYSQWIKDNTNAESDFCVPS